MSGKYPSVPDSRLEAGSWTLRNRSERVIFRLPGVTVTSHTLLYDDDRLRTAMTSAGIEGRPADSEADPDDLLGGTDGAPGRFFFASALSFRPPLPPGIGPAVLLSTVSKQAREALGSDLRSRGFERIEWDEGQRFRTESGDQGQLRKFTARLPVDEIDYHSDGLDIEGWLAAWTTDESFRIAGGAYPRTGLEGVLKQLSPSERPATDSRQFREELLELMRSVR